MKTLSTGVRAVVFDWGDTLMVNDGPQDQPMVTWTQVAAVEGVREALEVLSGKYLLVVATNARQSGAAQVTQALARVGLDEFFEQVFTVNELDGAYKPEAEFFRAVERRIGLSPDHILLIGDDPLVDVGGGANAGWRTVWFNPQQRAAPGLRPLASAEIAHLAALPDALEQPLLPSLEQIYLWLLEQRATANLLVHVEMVAALAYQLAVWLRNTGLPVNPLLAHRGGMLHDLTKITSRGSDVLHGDSASERLRSWGQPALAEIARTHMLFNILEESTCPCTWEEKIVYYADKLVENGQVVPFSQRMDALRQRYPLDTALLEGLAAAIPVLEAELCHPLGVSIDLLVENLRRAFLKGT